MTQAEKNIELEKREKFQRLAESRVDTVIDALRILGNCSNKSTYLYDEDQVEEIFGAIQEELDYIKERFMEKPKVYKSFRLSKRVELSGEEDETTTEEDVEEVIENEDDPVFYS